MWRAKQFLRATLNCQACWWSECRSMNYENALQAMPSFPCPAISFMICSEMIAAPHLSLEGCLGFAQHAIRPG